jgi:hypothetical protein
MTTDHGRTAPRSRIVHLVALLALGALAAGCASDDPPRVPEEGKARDCSSEQAAGGGGRQAGDDAETDRASNLDDPAGPGAGDAGGDSSLRGEGTGDCPTEPNYSTTDDGGTGTGG